MALLTIRQKTGKINAVIPHKLLINRQTVGVMQQKEVKVELPAGRYEVAIQSMIPFISATLPVIVQNGVCNVVTFRDREKVWDVVFWIDVILSILFWIFPLSEPYHLYYKIASNGFFILWLLRVWIIRKKYFYTEFYAEPLSPSDRH